jgi:hypothetical protein
MNYEMQMSERSSKITLYVRQPPGPPKHATTFGHTFPRAYTTLFLSLSAFNLPRCPCSYPTKGLSHFPHYRFLAFSATLDAHHPRTEQVLRTWKSTAALVYGLAFHLAYFKTLMKVAVVKSWRPTQVKCRCLVRYYVQDAFLIWPFLFVARVHWWLRVLTDVDNGTRQIIPSLPGK